MMRSMYRLLSLILILSMGQAVFAIEEDEMFEDMKGVLEESLRSQEQTEEKAGAVDSVLQKKFGKQVPNAAKVEISLDEVSNTKIKESYETLGNSNFKAIPQIRYQKAGAAMATLLWASRGGGTRAMIRDIIERGLQEEDPRDIVVTVNSNPIPLIKAETIDVNKLLYEKRLEKYKKASKALQFASPGAEKTLAPVEPKPLSPLYQMRIVISLGMMASVKNVDELAGQIYKAMAKQNPKVYGYKEDKRFLQAENIVKILDHIVKKPRETNDSELGDKELLRRQNYNKYYEANKNLMWAELSAMERLVEAGYNIWSVYEYEDRMNRWIQDVLLQSKNHRLNRYFYVHRGPLDYANNPDHLNSEDRKIGSSISEERVLLKDQTLPYRLQVMYSAVGYLEGADRGGSRLVKKSTPFGIRTKMMQWRMKLFANSFYYGLAAEVPIVVGGFTALGFALVSPQVYHSAYSAFVNTMGNAWETILPKSGEYGMLDTIGSWTERVMQWPKEAWQNSYLAAPVESFMAGEIVKYEHMLMAGGFAIGSYYLVKNFGKLSYFYQEYNKEIRDKQGKNIHEYREDWLKETEENRQARRIREGGYQYTPKETIKDSSGFGQRFFMGLIESAIDVRAYFGYKNSTTGHTGFVDTLISVKDYGVGVKNTSVKVASAGYALMAYTAVASARASWNGVIKTKNASVNAVKATPGVVVDGAVGIGKGAYFVAVGLPTGATMNMINRVQKTRLERIRKARVEMFRVAHAKKREKKFRAENEAKARAVEEERFKKEQEEKLYNDHVLKSYKAIKANLTTTSYSDFEIVIDDIINILKNEPDSKTIETLAAHIEMLSLKFRDRVLKGKSNLNEVVDFMAFIVRLDQFSKGDNKKFTSLGPFGYLTKDFNKPLKTVLQDNHKMFSVYSSIGRFLDEKGLRWYRLQETYEDKGTSPTNEERNSYYTEVQLNEADGKKLLLNSPSASKLSRITFLNGSKKLNIDYTTALEDNKQWGGWGILLKAMTGYARFVKLAKKMGTLNDSEKRKFLEYITNPDLHEIKRSIFFVKHIRNRFLVSYQDTWMPWLWEFGYSPSAISKLFYAIYSIQIKAHVNPGKVVLRNLKRYRKALAIANEQSPLDRIMFFTTLSRDNQIQYERGSKSGDLYIFKLLDRAKKSFVKDLFTTEGSTLALIEQMETLSKERNYRQLFSTDKDLVAEQLFEHILKNPEVLKTHQDIISFFENPMFWPKEMNTAKSTPIERPLIELFRMQKENRNSENVALNYDPVVSERIHQIVVQRMIALGKYPEDSDINARIEFWKFLTERGVSTLTDEMLDKILKVATRKQVKEVKTFAVEQGRVLDQGIQDAFALEEIVKSNRYKKLLKSSENAGERGELITALAELAQQKLKNMGIAYVNLLEDVAFKIGATETESKLINKLKTESLISSLDETAKQERSSLDNRVEMFSQILPYIKKWSAVKQANFLLYLRGSIEADKFPFIKKQFPVIGPERIRRMFQALPIAAATGIVNLYLKETLLVKKQVTEGQAKRVFKTILKQAGDKTSRAYAKQLVDALLKGIVRADNKHFQMSVLSAMVAMNTQHQSSIGETIKVILEQFPGVGPKIAQFLIPTGVLPNDINEVLRGAQDATLPPSQFEMYQDASSMLKGAKVPFRIIKPLGSGSMKYTYLAETIKSGNQVVMQVFRHDIQNNSELYIRILRETVATLVEKDERKWSFLEVVVEGAIHAVAKEKRYEREHVKNALAAKRIYTGFSDANFIVMVPTQKQMMNRFLSAQYALGKNFFDLSSYDKVMTGVKIMEMETDVLFSDKNVIWYDTDRHAGNYLIQVNDEKIGPKYRISPIDFGQLTHIRKEQRDNVLRLYSLGKLASLYGANDWMVKEVSNLLNLNPIETQKLSKNMYKFFKGASSAKDVEKVPVLTYYELLSVINRSVLLGKQDANFSGGKLRHSYSDFIRAVVQFNQYEDELSKVAPEVVRNVKYNSPIGRLTELSSVQMEKDLANMNFTAKQRVRLWALNAYRWVSTKLKGEDYTKFELRSSKEELMSYVEKYKESKLGGEDKKDQRLSAKESKVAIDALLNYKVTDPKSCKLAL